MNSIELVGLDIGTTTIRGLRVRARRIVSPVTGQTETVDPRVVSRLPTHLTPFRGADLDVDEVVAIIDPWFAACAPADGGGVLLTGLAARAPSAATLATTLRSRVPHGVVLAASDPRLESWVAFMGRARLESEAMPDRLIVNVDIGGGTSNIAWGLNGEVLMTASLHVGARHVRFEPGSRRIAAATPEARRLLFDTSGALEIGSVLSAEASRLLVERQVDALEDLIFNRVSARVLRAFPELVQAAPGIIDQATGRWDRPAINFSGGVADLMARIRQGATRPSTSHPGLSLYDDLGEELAAALLNSGRLTEHDGGSPATTIRTECDAGGLATVWGLTMHATELSGSTVFMSSTDLAPCADIPVVSRLDAATSLPSWISALTLARSSPGGAAILIQGLTESIETIRPLGKRLEEALGAVQWPADRLLVLLVGPNVGQVLGQYATGWGKSTIPMIVLDQVHLRAARLVTLGRPMGGMLPVSFSGLMDTDPAAGRGEAKSTPER